MQKTSTAIIQEGSVKSEIKAVIWDMGGVILRTEDHTPREELAKRYQVPLKELYLLVFESDTAQEAEKGNVTAAAHWDRIRAHFNLTAERLLDFQNDFWAGDQVDRELLVFIQSLGTRCKIALLSNAWSDARVAIEERYQFLKMFDQVYFSAELGMVKPDPAIYRLVLDKLGVQPHESIFVDDMPQNVAGAQEVGIHAVQFKSREQTIADIERLFTRGS